MSGLTTHVLDIANGETPAGIAVSLFAERDGAFHLVRTLRTNAQGRTDEPFLGAAEMQAGRYQLVFEVSAYYAGRGHTQVPFFDRVPVRFTIHRPHEHYHVPLLLAPWGYQSYRGS